MFLEEMLGQVSNNVGLLLSAGFLVGLLHAFEPDHMTAMMTQVRTSGVGRWRAPPAKAPAGLRPAVLRSSLLGAFWGFGHTSMVLLVSFLVFVFALSIPPAVFGGFELVVGVMLVVLGVSVYGKRAFRQGWHSHPHAHENGVVHAHSHEHGRGHSHTHRPYLIGCLHGLAGSGSLVAASAVTLGDVSGVLWFVMVFGIGSIAGMAAVSGTLSIPFVLSRSLARLRRGLQILAGTVTVAVGLWIIHGIAASGKLSAFL